MTCYGHAALLASRCARGCDKIAACISERDQQRICADHALEELVEDEKKTTAA